MEEFNTVNEVEVVTEAPQEAEAETSEVTETSAENATVGKVVESRPQSAEENAKYAAARRQAETEQKAIKAQNDRLLAALSQYGYQGTPDEIADAIMAQSQGITVEDARALREAEEAENQKYSALESQIETLREPARKFYMTQDLQKLKSTYPDDAKVQSIKDISELGGEFFSFMSVLRDPVLAYDALQAKKGRETKPIPQDIGAVNSSSSKEKDFYTSAELDKLTSKDLDNPKIYQAALRSLRKLGK